MKTLEQLIQDLCPNGVEFKKLGEVCDSLKNGILKQNQLEDDGIYPVINSGRDLYGRFSKMNNSGNAITFAARGEYAGFVNYLDCDFWAGGLCYPFRSKNESFTKTKFIYYYLKSIEENIRGTLVARGGIPAINKSDIVNIEIPVPPLAVQEKIVEILDKFTALTAELQAELQARQQQYEYYRDRLLSFGGLDNIHSIDANSVDRAANGSADDSNRGGYKWLKMSDIAEMICSGGTPSTSRKDFYQGNIPWLRTQEVDWKEIFDTEIKISENAVNNSSAKLIPTDCLIIAMYGATAAKACINRIPLTTNQACCNIKIDENIALTKYAYYWICNNYEKLKSLGEGSQSNLNAKKIKDFLIPIPSLSEQQRIVDILDRFEALINDIKQGLPAEIAARQQQYEYYRNKLLTFKRLPV